MGAKNPERVEAGALKPLGTMVMRTYSMLASSTPASGCPVEVLC
jgi:hypothetical protein